MAQTIIVLGTLLVPLLAGFIVPFLRDRAKLRRVLWWLAFAPAVLLVVGYLILSDTGINGGDLLVVGALVALAAIPAWLGRVIGRDVAAIWRERKTDKISETFR